MHDAENQAALHEARWAMLLPHRELALGLVLRTTGNVAEAEDCVHDAMVRLVRRRDLDPARVRALLIRAALHIAIDHQRAAARRQSAVVRLRGGAMAAVVSPEEIHAERVEAGRVLAAIDSLPRRERQVMLLRLAGLNVAETAARLGISYKSVEGAYTRARARVRYLLAAVFGGVVERLRRTASPGGEVAAPTMAALLLLGPAATGVGAGEYAGAAPPGGAHRAVSLAAGSNPPAAAHQQGPPSSHDPQPAAPRQPHPSPGTTPQLHRARPDATVGAPVDAPLGLAGAGVYVTVGPVGPPATDPGACPAGPAVTEVCVQATIGDPWASC